MIFTRRVLAALPLAGPVLAQGFPSQPIRLVTPYPPGGGTDTVARMLLPHLVAQLGQTIIVENRGGAGGAQVAL
jgi:tripartite-type tricarboxylate transporter receptor subunit TctC